MEKPSKPLTLLVFATDTMESLKTKVEMQSLRSILEPVARRLDYEVQILEYSTIDHFVDCLDDNRDRLILLHFAGHSNSELLQLDEGEAHAHGLAEKLQACQHLQLLFLNGCSNAHQVQRFVEVGIPATIGTYYPINDSIACEFSEDFYTELVARQQPIASAFKQAKETISTKYGSKYHSLNVRSFGDENEDTIPKKWAWFLEQNTEEYDWEFEEAAHACNRLPVLPPKTTQDLPDLLFKNLYYYQSSDADIFFGRCQATLDILTLLDNPDFPLLLLHGGTGVGKSSFLMAGLIPRLLARQQAVNQPVRFDGQISLENLLPLVFNTTNLADIHLQLDASGKQPSIWILDQVEEIFFQSEKEITLEASDNIIQKEERQDNIPDALNLLLKTLKALFPANNKEQWPNTRIILTLRTEWFGELHNACRSYQLTTQDYMLNPLGKADIIEIIEQPTKKKLLIDKYGLQIETLPLGKLSEQIADDLLEDRESNIAPPLQIILSKLWQDVAKLPKQERIWTQKLYEQKKAQGLLLSEHLDHQLQEIGKLSNQQDGNWGKEANDSGLLIDILHSYTTIQGTSKTCSIHDYNTHYAHISYRDLLVRTFTDRYLLIDPSNKRKQYRLAHDALAKVVKVKYETSELPGQRARRILDSRSTDWIEVDNKYKGTALDKFDLKLVETGELGTRDWRQDKKQVAIIQKSKKKRRNGRFVFSGVIIGFIVAFLVTALLYFQAEEQRQIAEDEKLEANYQLAKAYEQKALLALSNGHKAQEKNGNKSFEEYRKAWLFGLEAENLLISKKRTALTKLSLMKLSNVSSKKISLIKSLITSPIKNHSVVRALAESSEHLAFSEGKVIQVWNSKSGRITQTLKDHKLQINALDYNPAGTVLASASDDKTVKLWKAKSGELIQTLKGHFGKILSLAFSPDGTMLAFSDLQTVYLWNFKSGQLIQKFKKGYVELESLAFSPDGTTIASSTKAETVRLWNIKTGKLIQTLSGNFGIIRVLTYSPDGLVLALGSSDSNIILWNIVSSRKVQVFKGDNRNSISALAYSPDGKILASGSSDNTIKLWDLKRNQLKRTLEGHSNTINALSYSSDGMTLASASSDSTVRLWDVKPKISNNILKSHPSAVTNLIYSPDGSILASTSYERKKGFIQLWDSQTGELIRTLEGHSDYVTALAYSPDGSVLASASVDESLKLWNPRSGNLIKSLKGHNQNDYSLNIIYALAYSPNGTILASASDDKTIRLWDAKSGNLLQILTGHTDAISTLAYSSNGKILASGSHDKTIILWDAETGELKHILKGHNDWISALAFHPDGKQIASGSQDNTVKLWNAKSGELIQTIKEYSSWITALTYNPSGTLLASATLSDHNIKLWDTSTRQFKQIFEAHPSGIRALAYNFDGSVLASGSDDKTIRLWDESQFTTLKLFYDFDPQQVLDALKFLWENDLDKNTRFFPLLDMPKKDESKLDQLVHFLENHCAYKDRTRVESCKKSHF